MTLAELGRDLTEWHAGQADPIYAVGSHAVAGRVHPDPAARAACASELRRIARYPEHRYAVDWLLRLAAAVDALATPGRAPGPGGAG